jgi:Sec-independent protein secretion pathway component TatC
MKGISRQLTIPLTLIALSLISAYFHKILHSCIIFGLANQLPLYSMMKIEPLNIYIWQMHEEENQEAP